MSTVPPHPLLNGKYRLLRPIGRGGMGSVYLALHIGMGRRVAVKILPMDRVQNRSYVERFRREARAAAALDHPNIVRAHDFDQVGDVHYLVMEYVDGPNLANLVKKQSQPLPVETVVRWISQAASALQHAHDRAIVHRDVKPANLLVTKEGDIKLLDLGLARWSEGDDSSLTVANQERVMGTVDYLAPEQALDSHTADARADIYSLGCTLYYALTGRPPFAEGTIGERIARHQTGQAKSLCHHRADVPRELDDVCQRMLAKDPADRYQSAAEVVTALAACLRSGRSSGFDPDPSAPQARATPAGPGPGIHFEHSDPLAELPELPRSDESISSVRSRIGLPSPAKNPPAVLWFGIGLLILVAVVLAWFVRERGL